MRVISTAILIGLFLGTAQASQVTVSSVGINSTGLTRFDGTTILTGAGIGIGQVEPHRPGDVQAGDDADHRNSSIDPEAVFRRNGSSTPNEMGTEHHGSWVASVMISTDALTRGVSTGAKLYSSQTDPTAPFYDRDAALSAQHIALQNDGDVRAINLSFVYPLDNILDGNQLLTQFVDWSASRHDVLYVTGGKNTTSPAGYWIPSDNYNGITVAASAISNGKYSRAAAINDFSMEAVSNTGSRTIVSLMAPGQSIHVGGLDNSVATETGRSFAAPHVTATVALLQEYGDERILNGAANRWGETVVINSLAYNTPRRHEVMKAVLLNSADKLIDDGSVLHPITNDEIVEGRLLGMERTVERFRANLNDPPVTWFDSFAYGDGFEEAGEGYPLDDQMGAGHLNAKRAYQQFIPGEYDSDSSPVPSIAWDFGMTTEEGDVSRYQLSEELQAEHFISITLAWDREVELTVDDGVYNSGDTFSPYTETDPYADDVISDLDLYLVPRGLPFNLYTASSISSETTLEHIFFEIPETGEYDIVVHQADEDVGPQHYGLAWWYGLAPEVEPPDVTGDFDSDGDVDGRDFLDWQRGDSPNGTAGGPISARDLADWQSGYDAFPLTASATAVPRAWECGPVGFRIIVHAPAIGLMNLAGSYL